MRMRACQSVHSWLGHPYWGLYFMEKGAPRPIRCFYCSFVCSLCSPLAAGAVDFGTTPAGYPVADGRAVCVQTHLRAFIDTNTHPLLARRRGLTQTCMCTRTRTAPPHTQSPSFAHLFLVLRSGSSCHCHFNPPPSPHIYHLAIFAQLLWSAGQCSSRVWEVRVQGPC